jgi:hypothetical protein
VLPLAAASSGLDVLAAVAAGLSALVAGVAYRVGFRSVQGRAQEAETFDQRVTRLTKSLDEAGHVVSELEHDIRSRQRLVERLREEQKLLELTREEVDAVAQTLRGELRREGRKALWLNIGQSAAFFVLGAALTVLIK